MKTILQFTGLMLLMVISVGILLFPSLDSGPGPYLGPSLKEVNPELWEETQRKKPALDNRSCKEASPTVKKMFSQLEQIEPHRSKQEIAAMIDKTLELMNGFAYETTVVRGNKYYTCR